VGKKKKNDVSGEGGKKAKTTGGKGRGKGVIPINLKKRVPHGITKRGGKCRAFPKKKGLSTAVKKREKRVLPIQGKKTIQFYDFKTTEKIKEWGSHVPARKREKEAIAKKAKRGGNLVH